MKKILIAVVAVVLVALAAPAFAAATNPFMDVPANHWAYDAVSQLAARGVISGYPDGSYKGAQPSTRYEMASVVARALAKIDLEKASKQDVELLKKLIVEFKDELDALGVKVADLDERVAVLETDIGGWSLAGELRFDARFFGDNENTGFYTDPGEYHNTGANQFNLNRYRIYIRKRIDENTNFTARLGHFANDTDGGYPGMRWEHYYVTTKLPYDITFRVGHANLDYEDDLGLYQDEDAWVGDWDFNQLRFTKNWGLVDFDLVLGRSNDDGWPADGSAPGLVNLEQFLIAANINLNFNEKLRAGLLGYWHLTDDELADYYALGVDSDTDLATYGAYLGFRFIPTVEVKGIYYWQSQGQTLAEGASGAFAGTVGYDDSAKAWKAIVDVDREALKFTSLWLEYGQIDNNFIRFTGTNPYAWGGAEILANKPWNLGTTTVWLIRANQQWNDKWDTFLRYAQADFDTLNLDNANNWTLGVGYQYTPAIKFELLYDNIDYGNSNGNLGGYIDDDHLIQFRTHITF
jgi:hypothetical protein